METPTMHELFDGSDAALLNSSGSDAIASDNRAPAHFPEKLLIDFVIPGEPKGKGRARSRIAKGRNGAQFVAHYTPSGTVEYENLVRMAAHEAMSGRGPTGFPCRVTVLAYCSVPASWSKKKQAKAHLGEVFPTGKPDLDNVTKAVLDGMNKIVFIDDSLVCSLTVSKNYSATPRVEVMVRELDGEAAR